MNISIIGLNHNSAPIDIREKFAVPDDAGLPMLAKLSNTADEIVILSTCNRTELIYSVDDADKHELINRFVKEWGQLSADDFDRFFYAHQNTAAMNHLFRVAAGLDSMIPGETQILGQVKDAFEKSIKNGYTGTNFNLLYQHMLNTAKSVRTDTELSRGSVSVSTVAVQLARNIFGTLEDKVVLLVGAGEMAELAASQFYKAGVKTIHVVNRDRDRARQLAGKYGGTGHALDEIPQALGDTDIILSSVADQHNLITREIIEKAMCRRHGVPLFVIDIAIPRNIHGSVNDITDVYLYNIDDLQYLVTENLRERQREAAKGEKIVQKKVSELASENGELISGVIKSLQIRVAEVKENELKKLFRRNEELSEETKNQVEHTINAIINKILHDPILSLRKSIKGNDSGPRNIIRIFKDFFNL